MTRWKLRLWAVGCFGWFLVALPAVVLALTGFWENGRHEGSYPFALAATLTGWTIFVVTLIAAFVHTARRSDLDPKSRRRWLWGLFLLNGYLLPAFWYRLIRPLGAQPR